MERRPPALEAVRRRDESMEFFFFWRSTFFESEARERSIFFFFFYSHSIPVSLSTTFPGFFPTFLYRLLLLKSQPPCRRSGTTATVSGLSNGLTLVARARRSSASLCSSIASREPSPKRRPPITPPAFFLLFLLLQSAPCSRILIVYRRDFPFLSAARRRA
jgi:hypothetical protein